MAKSTTMRLSALIAVLALVVAGCSGVDAESTTTEGGTDTTEAPDTTEPSNEGTTTTEGSGIVGEGATLRANWGGFPETWTPGADTTQGYPRLPYETLITMDEDGELVGQLATDWEHDDTGLTLTLREGVTFHDGTPFNAEAVQASIEATQQAPTEYGGRMGAVSSVEVIDEMTVKLNTDGPHPSLPFALTSLAGFMVSPTALDAGTLETEPVGTGPWAYNAEASSPGTRMNFDYFPDYWGGRESVAFDTVELYGIGDDNAAAGALLGGEIDITDAEEPNLPDYDADPAIEWLDYVAIRNGTIFFDRGPGGMFEDVQVRRAACHAIDNAVVAQAGDAEPASQVFLEGQVGYVPGYEGIPYDPEQAQTLYDEAGNPPVEGEMLATFFTESISVATADFLGEIGMDISVQTVPPPQWFGAWNGGQYPLGIGAYDELHPYDVYLSHFAADAAANPSGAESEELRAAAEVALAAGVSGEADELWAEVMRVIYEEALTCARMFGPELIAWNAETIDGVTPGPIPFETSTINYRALRPAGS